MREKEEKGWLVGLVVLIFQNIKKKLFNEIFSLLTKNNLKMLRGNFENFCKRFFHQLVFESTKKNLINYI